MRALPPPNLDHRADLALHNPQDEIIPYRLGQRLFDAAPEPKTFFELRGDHDSGFIQIQPGYEEALRAFLERLPVSRW